MKSALRSLCVLLFLCTFASQAAVISNGDFQSCDFTAWEIDTDGFGDLGPSPDFSIANNAGECSAEIFVDDFTSAQAFYANTLFTDLDLAASGSQILTLSFDWIFSGTDGDALLGDYFSVYLGDGSGSTFDESGELGFLLDPTSEYGAGNFSIALDPSIYNQMGFSLEFQLFDALSPTQDPLFSVLNIDNVQLQVSNIAVSSPYVLLVLITAVAFAYRRSFNK